MLDRFRGLSTFSKVLVGGACGLGCLLVVAVVVVLATGGFTNPF
jgi:hypothetical protein